MNKNNKHESIILNLNENYARKKVTLIRNEIESNSGVKI